MADVTISELANLTVTSSLLLPVTNGSTTGKLTIGDINSLVTKSSLGLGNVENKSSATIRSEITSGNVTTALGYTPYNSTNPSGYINSSNSSVSRAWVNFTGTNANNTNCTINNSYNVSSVLRETIDRFRINFTNPLPSSEYVVVGCGRYPDNVNNDSAPDFGVYRFGTPMTANYVQVVCQWTGGGANKERIYVAIFC